MPFTLKMPKLSPTMEEGEVVKWHVQEGEFVEAGAVLIEVATDKATLEYNALDEGWLRKILIPAGGVAKVNQAIAIFTAEESESIEGYQPEGAAPAAEEHQEEEAAEGEAVSDSAAPAKKATTGEGFAEPSFQPEPPLTDYTFPEPTRRWGGHLATSPLARKRAEEEGLDLSSVEGSGPGGRIVARDLDRAQPAASVSFGAPKVPHLPPGSYEHESLTPMRRIVGKRLQQAKTFIPHFYVTQEIEVGPLLSLRKQLKEGYGLKVTVTDFIVRATALTLRSHPAINSGFDTVEQSLIRFQTIDLSIAVSLDEGLVTPVIRHADYKTIGQLSTELRDLALRARQGKLQPEEWKGGSFTISNLGMYGVEEFVAVINPPQGSILAIGGTHRRPVIQEETGEIGVGYRMRVTLSTDHRVADGRDSARFLQDLKRNLENPAGLLLL